MLDEVFVLDFLPGSFEIGGNSGVLVFFYTVDGRFTIFTFTMSYLANVYIHPLNFFKTCSFPKIVLKAVFYEICLRLNYSIRF